ncbi:MAG TPA: hypothetical protein VFA59_20425 [Vicinamibacterales bacterium]|nr:hypothetical protein [Vicinamibacterales bacterium]
MRSSRKRQEFEKCGRRDKDDVAADCHFQNGLIDLRQGKPMTKENAVDLDEFERIVDIGKWAAIEKRFGARPNR